MAMTPIQSCIARIAQAGKLSQAEARDLMDRLDARAQRLARERGMSPIDAVRQAGLDAEADEAAAALIKKRNALMNLQKRIGRRGTMEDAAAQFGTAAKPDLAKAVQNQVIAVATPVNGGRFSAEAYWKTRAAEYAGTVVSQLKKAGLLKTVRDGSLGDAWARELYELSIQAAGDARANPGVTGNPVAQQIAGIFHAVQQTAKERLNREGAWIGDYAGYITRTTHDMDKIRRAGFDDWRAMIEPRLADRTFDGVDDRAKFLKGVWSGLVTGVHLSDEGGIGFKDPAFVGPANAAAKLSAERVLHFRDASSWLQYQRQFGTGSLLDQMMAGFDRSARQEALLQRWGTNPRAEYDADVRYLTEKYRDTAPDSVVRLGDRSGTLGRQFDMLDGKANRPGNRLGAQISADIRTVESMAKLGLVAFTHMSAAVTKAAELRYQGIGFLERYGNFFDSLLQGRGRGEMGELSDLLLAGTEGMHGRLLARFQPDDTVPGTMSKLANRFFDMSGLTWLLDAQKAGAERIMSRHLGSLIDRDFGQLPPETQRGLKQYAISQAEWDTLRNAPGHFESSGRVYLTPDAATRADPNAVSAAWRAARDDVRAVAGKAASAFKDRDPTAAEISGTQDALALKLHAYFADVANRSIVTPGIGDRAAITGGTNPGTIVGEAMRFVAQFKLWGLAAVRQGIGREIYGGQGTAGAISGVVQMAIGAAAFGYMTMFLKDMSKGLTPRAPNDPRTWMAAMIQGGGFGIMGDYLFGEYSRFGGGIGESVLGPVLGQGLTELMNVWNMAKEGAVADAFGIPGQSARRHDIAPELVKIVTNNTPFVNLFYTRTALNYLFLHSLQESMNPGYLRRTEQQLQKRTGQTHWLNPTSHLQPFGH